MITQQDIQSLVNAAKEAGFKVNINDLELTVLKAGIGSHIPPKLPQGNSAVYIFEHSDGYLKVGKAGPKSSARFGSHHYHTTAPSTLAKSLLISPLYKSLFAKPTVKDWIISNTTRYNILIPESYNAHFLNFAEAFFILKCNPKFERKAL